MQEVPKDQREYYGGLAQELQQLVFYKCLKKYQKYDVYLYFQQPYHERSMIYNFYYTVLGVISPPEDLNDEDKDELNKYMGDPFQLCFTKSSDYVEQHIKEDIKHQHDCFETCVEEFPENKVFNFPRRSRCRRRCENQFNNAFRMKIAEGKFPGATDHFKDIS
ncbi:hypothetical protein pb186bvf_010408 [Paramecium bursaria]